MKKSAAVFANKNMSNATCPRFAFSATLRTCQVH